MTNWNSLKSWAIDQVEVLYSDTSGITADTVDNSLEKVTHIIQQASQKIPRGRVNTWQRKISDLSKRLISQRNKYKRKFQRCTDSNRKSQISSILKL